LKGAPGPEWKVVKEAVQRLIRIAELLLTILHNKDEGFDQFVELARRDARDYWQTIRRVLQRMDKFNDDRASRALDHASRADASRRNIRRNIGGANMGGSSLHIRSSLDSSRIRSRDRNSRRTDSRHQKRKRPER